MQMHVIASLLYKMQYGNIRYFTKYMRIKNKFAKNTNIFKMFCEIISYALYFY